MFLSMNWIRDFVNLDGIDLDNLVHQFTLGTAEVEGIEHIGKDTFGVVVGQILTVDEIPESKKLHKLTVDTGDKVWQIMCGAPNVKVGMKVPVAKLGGQVGGMKIEDRKLAGYESQGMCCSQKELGVSDDHSGLWELPEDLPLGKDIKEIYEIEDTVFEVDNKSLTNRPDLWGHYGIAREIAALSGRELQPYPVQDLSAFDSLPKVPISIEDPELCYRYSGMTFSHVTKNQSPVNMQIRLFRCGMRGINLLADLTNYLMLEMGQPMHAFDYKRVDAIEVGHLEGTQVFQTLDGKERTIQPEMLMIKSHGEPVAVAGIMGGLASEIVEDTDSFLLESANFNAVSVRKTAQAIGLRTDASMRYEKTLDPEMTTTAIARYLKLLMDIDPSVKVTSRLTDNYPWHYPVRTIVFDKAYVDRLTGIDISEERIARTLTHLGFALKRDGKDFIVTVPSWRATKDVTIKADIIEEITRIYGYDNFEIKTSKMALYPMKPTPEHRLHSEVKNLLAFTYGAHEVHTYVWNDGKRLGELGLSNEGKLHLVNSVSPDIDTIREELVPALLCVALKNKGYSSSYSIFEIGSVVPAIGEDNLAKEEKHLGAVLYGRKADEGSMVAKAKAICESIAQEIKGVKFTYRPAEAAEVKEWAHPYNSFVVSLAGAPVGLIAVVHPTVASKIEKKAAAVAVELNMDQIYPLVKVLPQFREPSRFPSITSDVTFIVDAETAYSEFERVIGSIQNEHLASTDLDGIYVDQALTGKKSVTIRFTFTSNDRTLEMNEVLAYVAAYREAMKEIGAVVIDA